MINLILLVKIKLNGYSNYNKTIRYIGHKLIW